MRTFAIAKKVLRELIRDKRTLAMMFLAPILIMWLMNVMFSANSTTDVSIGVVGMPQTLVQTIDKTSHVNVKAFSELTDAKSVMKEEKIDAIIEVKGDNHYSITYANRDSSKTNMTRQVFKGALTANQMSILNQTIAKLVSTNPVIAKSLPTKSNSIKIKESYDYGNKDSGFFTKMIPILMGYIVFFFVFLISGMALLRERTTGTLYRLLATPVRRVDIVLGYMLSYGLLAIIQTLVIVFATIWLLDVEVAGSIFYVVLTNFILALVALAFGILLSTLAKSEFQMMQFIPIVVIPQLFFSGLIPLDSMADWVQVLGKFLPLSYSGHALTQVMLWGKGWSSIDADLGVLLIFLLTLNILNVFGLRRYRKV